MSLSVLVFSLLCAVGSGHQAAPPVAVNVYYESLCPFCQQFISGSLSFALEKVGQIMNVTFVPWGNERAHETTEGVTFTCQHGEEECRLNVVHACALRLARVPGIGVEFIVCMESNNENQALCSEKTGIDSGDIDACTQDPAMDKEMLRLRDITDAVRPKIRGVPTVEVNGSQDPQYEIINDLLSVVCREYTGPKPTVCY